MIKHYDSHLIPIKSSLAYPNIDYSLPRGSPYIRSMKLRYALSNTYYSYSIKDIEVRLNFYDPNSFYLMRFSTPHVRRRSPNAFLSIWAEVHETRNFRTSDEAYIDMFLNSSWVIDKYPEKYQQIYTKYPEHFI